MTFVESKEGLKTAYPYITRFKKEPFKSFVLLPRQKIGSFYFSQYDKVTEFHKFFLKNLKDDKSLNLETLYWFLLLLKYLKEDIGAAKNDFYKFIKLCEIKFDDKLGFNNSPVSLQEKPDVWSTYFALASLHLLGKLEEYLKSKGKHLVRNEIKKFINSHDEGNAFRHCLAKNCDVCEKDSSAKTLYYVIESLVLLEVEVRTEKYNFLEYIGDVKKDPSIIFKII
ncbi:MAG: prenyltransferase/squalene oxidase repeat-containing protein, partial [Promethearchaeota archaeon]